MTFFFLLLRERNANNPLHWTHKRRSILYFHMVQLQFSRYKSGSLFLLWQKCQKFSNFKIRVCAVHSIGIRNVKLGFAAMLTNTICGVYGNQVKNRKILWRNQHIFRGLINLFVENVNCKVIFSTMKLDMRAKMVTTCCYKRMSCKNIQVWNVY